MTHLRRTLAVAALAAGVGSAVFAAWAAAPIYETAWQPGANARARLLAAGGDGPMRAGVEIALEPDAHTYWRDPGDAGVPPKIAFEGSRNLKRAELRFPAPERIDEGGLTVIGYRKPVILPIEVEPEDPRRPVHLRIAFAYAACAKICTPAEASAALDLPPGGPAGPHDARLAAAAAAIPARTARGEAVDFELKRIAPSPEGKMRWSIRPSRPNGPWRDLFAEGPDGWFYETQASGDGFTIVAAQAPAAHAGPAPARLTLAGAPSYEIATELP